MMPNPLPSVSRSLWSLLLVAALGACQNQPTEESPKASPATDAAPASTARATGPDTLHLLAPGQAGPTRIGMRVGALRAQFGPTLRDVTLQRDDEQFPAFAVGRVGKTTLPALLLEPQCQEGEDNRDGSPSDHCRIWRITVRDPSFRTSSGLGVGSTFGQIKTAAPISYVGQSPMGIAATIEAWHLDFLLDVSAIAARGLPAHLETIHDSVRVVGVQLYRP